jgi:hypothetical protein
VKLKDLVLIIFLLMFIAACSKPENSQPANTEPKKEPASQPASPAQPAAETGSDQGSSHGSSKDEIPADVKALFPDAQSIAMLHKDFNAGHVASVEKDYGLRLKETDYHTYVAYKTDGGKRSQIGAATVVDVEGAGEPIQMAVAYSNDIVIKNIKPLKGSSDVASAAFLNQFIGKNHDEPFQVGKDIKYQGNNKAAAEAVALAVKRDILSMQTLYGKAHTH